MATDGEWHVLIQDDDGHWYVCPADKQMAAEGVFAATPRYELVFNWPDWLVKVGGAPSLVRFRDYEIR